MALPTYGSCPPPKYVGSLSSFESCDRSRHHVDPLLVATFGEASCKLTPGTPPPARPSTFYENQNVLFYQEPESFSEGESLSGVVVHRSKGQADAHLSQAQARGQQRSFCSGDRGCSGGDGGWFPQRRRWGCRWKHRVRDGKLGRVQREPARHHSRWVRAPGR